MEWLVIGHASVVHEIDRLVDLVAVEYRPWVSGRERHVIEVAGEWVTGRRLVLDRAGMEMNA